MWRRAPARYFNPPTPCGVGLCVVGVRHQVVNRFQSTHPVWGGTGGRQQAPVPGDISIHPPRVGWDTTEADRSSDRSYFNPPTPCGVGPVMPSQVTGRVTISIHPPRVGWDPERTFVSVVSLTFQSTHPVWGGTRPTSAPLHPCFISIHPPRVGWDCLVWAPHRCVSISIHPPRVGWDPPTTSSPPCWMVFQSTHPVWGGTYMTAASCSQSKISIHPPRVGWDGTRFDWRNG